MISKGNILCPSYRCKPGSWLLGIRNAKGTISILPQPLLVTTDFIDQSKALERPVEQYFRFTNKCIESGCAQWNGSGCNVADRVFEFSSKITGVTSIPRCSIRSQCRWFIQKGIDGCRICPLVLSEITKDEAYAAIELKEPAENP